MPNPFQPRREFDSDSLHSLAESIRQYGVLQPLVVTRKERERPDGGISVEYELVAGERRLRASKLAGIRQVPVLIRSSEYSDKMKLEVAIIENLQREDLNPIDRAKAFKQLADQFNLKHGDIAERVGKSREYVSNSMRLLMLPEEMQEALIDKKVSEGHTRALLMLAERPEEQEGLFREIMERKLTVRETERIARSIAVERKRKQDLSPDLMDMQRELTEKLGTRVRIEQKENGGKVHIDFFSPEDMHHVLALLASIREESERADDGDTMRAPAEDDSTTTDTATAPATHENTDTDEINTPAEEAPAELESFSPLRHFIAQPAREEHEADEQRAATAEATPEPTPTHTPDAQPEQESETNLYSIRNFSL